MPTHDKVARGRVREVLVRFLTDVSTRIPDREFEQLLLGNRKLEKLHLRYKPEDYTRHNLVDPLLDEVGLQYQPEPRSQGICRPRWPDVEITSTNIPYIVEIKQINNVETGVAEIKEYLSIEGFETPYGILTDGIEWRIYGPPKSGGEKSNPILRKQVSFSDTIKAVARKERIYDVNTLSDDIIDNGPKQIKKFTAAFSRDKLDSWALEQLTKEYRNKFLEDGRSLQSSLDGNWN